MQVLVIVYNKYVTKPNNQYHCNITVSLSLSSHAQLLTDAKLNRRYGKDLQDLPPNHSLIVITCPEDIPTQCPRCAIN